MTGSAGTNGFLFCDLRGYAAYVDTHGDRAAAELLGVYRALVREVIAAHAGAEIRTEGDSIYVVFPTASAAVEAGLAIVDAAASAGTAERPVRVGVGIHAGETIATGEGPVGSAVNIAARSARRPRPARSSSPTPSARSPGRCSRTTSSASGPSRSRGSTGASPSTASRPSPPAGPRTCADGWAPAAGGWRS